MARQEKLEPREKAFKKGKGPFGGGDGVSNFAPRGQSRVGEQGKRVIQGLIRLSIKEQKGKGEVGESRQAFA